MMDYATRYRCRQCETDTFIPERPLHAPRTVRCGCDECGMIVRHKKVGVR